MPAVHGRPGARASSVGAVHLLVCPPRQCVLTPAAPDSRAVSHPGTNAARPCLASELRRDQVRSVKRSSECGTSVFPSQSGPWGRCTAM